MKELGTTVHIPAASVDPNPRGRAGRGRVGGGERGGPNSVEITLGQLLLGGERKRERIRSKSDILS